ncbi:hypothetical protein LQZ18_12365 [Lachnospiraceae bacterium ZAX-1]
MNIKANVMIQHRFFHISGLLSLGKSAKIGSRKSVKKEVAEMGLYLDPSNENTKESLHSEIYVDKTSKKHTCHIESFNQNL